MSLDVYLRLDRPVADVAPNKGTGIFVRDNGSTREITEAEWYELNPARDPYRLTESVLEDDEDEVFSANITHNLGKMAQEAGIYQHLWRPDELGITKARELIEPLRNNIDLMEREPERFKAFDSPNGWGLYIHFMPWLHRYLAACEEYPDATVSVSR